MRDAGTAIERALRYLSGRQLDSGEFPVYVWSDPPGLQPMELDSSVFPTAVIAHSLSFSGSEMASEMYARAVQFLLREMEPGAVWRYWASDNPKHFAIPPDVDDIACASAVLRKQGAAFPDNRELILANRDPRGRFYTWVTPRLRWNGNLRYWRTALPQLRRPYSLYRFWHGGARPDDVDCVVNANVLFYLGGDPALRPVADFIVEVIRRQGEGDCDKWYFNPLVIYYFISRCFASGVLELGVLREPIVERIGAATGKDGEIGGTPLDTATAICALLDWKVDADLDHAVTSLTGRQQESGAWERGAVYGGGSLRWESEELTTAFCLEALLRYDEIRGRTELRQGSRARATPFSSLTG